MRWMDGDVTSHALVTTLAVLFEMEEDARRAHVLAAAALGPEDPVAEAVAAARELHRERRDLLAARLRSLGAAAPDLVLCKGRFVHGAAGVARAAGRQALVEHLRALRLELRDAYRRGIDLLEQSNASTTFLGAPRDAVARR